MSEQVKIEVTDFNTNNAWGFGGGIGKLVKIGEWSVKYGTAYFRHINAEKFVRYFQTVEGKTFEVCQNVFETGTGLTLKQVQEKVKGYEKTKG